MLHLYAFLACQLQAKCIDLGVAILYIVLVSVFFGWGLFHRTRKQSPASRTKPLWNNVMEDADIHSVNREKNENPPMQVETNFRLFTKYQCIISFTCVCVLNFYNLCVWLTNYLYLTVTAILFSFL